MDNENENKNKFKWGMETAKGVLNVANTIQELQNPNTTGGKRLLSIINTILSFGGKDAEKTLEE